MNLDAINFEYIVCSGNNRDSIYFMNSGIVDIISVFIHCKVCPKHLLFFEYSDVILCCPVTLIEELCLSHVQPEGSGDFAMGTDGRLSRRGERQMVPFVFTGVSIAHPRMFENAPQGRFSLNKLWDEAIDKGRLFGVRLEGLWMHVGTPEALTEAERWIESEDVA